MAVATIEEIHAEIAKCEAAAWACLQRRNFHGHKVYSEKAKAFLGIAATRIAKSTDGKG